MLLKFLSRRLSKRRAKCSLLSALLKVTASPNGHTYCTVGAKALALKS